MSRKYSDKGRINRNRAVVAATLPAPCVRCGALVLKEHRWTADHITSRAEAELLGWTVTEVDSPSNLGAAHYSCNSRAGAQLGNALRKQIKKEVDRIERIERPQPSF